jgi:hypothetical protein
MSHPNLCPSPSIPPLAAVSATSSLTAIDEYFSSLPNLPVQLPEEQRTFADLTDQLPEFEQDAAAILKDVCS